MYTREGVKSKAVGKVYSVWSAGGAGEEVRGICPQETEKKAKLSVKKSRVGRVRVLRSHLLWPHISMATQLGYYYNSYIEPNPGEQRELPKVNRSTQLKSLWL